MAAEADAPRGEDEALQRRRRAVAVRLFTQQLGVAHLRSKALGWTPAPALDFKGPKPQRSRRHISSGHHLAAAPAGAADEGVRVVYGAGPMALDGSEGQQHPAAAAAPAQRPRRRRRAPLALELPGFSPRPKRDAGGGGGDAAAGARGGFAEAAAAAAAAVQDRGPPPGWVRVNADGEEEEAAPADADEFIMEAADDAAFDEEEWV